MTYATCRETTASGLPCCAPASKDRLCVAHRRRLAALAEKSGPSPSLEGDRPGMPPCVCAPCLAERARGERP